jgi:hypothetical protein
MREANRPVQKLSTYGGSVVAWNPFGNRLLASASESELHIWDLRGGFRGRSAIVGSLDSL